MFSLFTAWIRNRGSCLPFHSTISFECAELCAPIGFWIPLGPEFYVLLISIPLHDKVPSHGIDGSLP